MHDRNDSRSEIWLKLARDTVSNPAEAARHLLTLRPEREALWLAFALAVVLNGLVQLGIDFAVPVVPETDAAPATNSIPLVLLRSAGAMLLSVLFFWIAGRALGGKASFENLMVLTIWLQFMQIAGLCLTLVVGLMIPFLLLLSLMAIIILSFYITLHFVNEAHQFGSLWKAFAVILISAVVAMPVVFMFAPAGPV